MESRSIYLRVTELLRGYHAPVTVKSHRHSNLSLYLRNNVLDSTIRFEAALANMQAWCSLHGNPKADLSAAVDALKGIYAGALSEIPYLMGGKTSEELKNSDRDEAIRKYRAMRTAATKSKSEVQHTETIKPKVANKHRV